MGHKGCDSINGLTLSRALQALQFALFSGKIAPSRLVDKFQESDYIGKPAIKILKTMIAPPLDNVFCMAVFCRSFPKVQGFITGLNH